MDDGALPPWTRHQTPPAHPPHSPSFSLAWPPPASSSSNAAHGMEEEDICRVCRESTPDVPLLHPWYSPPLILCHLNEMELIMNRSKCSGSIKYVHQECLLQWIKTKKVTKCELCKYPFKMSKGTDPCMWAGGANSVVYDPRMPSRVPHRLFLQRLLLQLRNNLLTYLRFMLVCFIWLGLVPFVARWIWRFYFRFGDWSVAPAPPSPSASASAVLPITTVDNVTVYPLSATPATTENGTTDVGGVFEEGFFGWLKGQDIWTGILRDCFQGQIITICLVAVFVVVFLIREWVMQNAVAVIEEPPVVEARRGIPAVQLPDEEHDERIHTPDAEQEEPELYNEPDETENGEYAFDDDSLELVGLEDGPWRANTPPAQTDDDAPILIEPAPVVADPRGQVAVRNFEAEQPVPRNNDFFEDDDLDADDFDGLWDILGMQGPIIGLLHNTVFSALMIALAVGLGVWLPFMFGKTALGALVRYPLVAVD